MFRPLFKTSAMLLSASVLLVDTGLMAATDPTRPLSGVDQEVVSTQPAAGGLVLQSIIKQQGEQPIKAIISGKLVTQGQRVFGYQVVTIESRSVTLKSEDNVRKLTLFTHPIVKYK